MKNEVKKTQDYAETGEALKLENQLCFPLYAAARQVTNAYQPFLKPLGITYTQYLVFLVLWEHDGSTVNEICAKLRLDNGTITPLLKKLETEGFIKRCRCEHDERCVRVFLTERGEALKSDAAGIPAKVGRCVDIPKEDAATLYRILYKIIG